MKKNLALISLITFLAILILTAYLVSGYVGNSNVPAEKQEDEQIQSDDNVVGEDDKVVAEDGSIINETEEDEVMGVDTNNKNNMDDNIIINKIEKENGLIIEVVKEGEGKEAKNGNSVSVHYTGKLKDGTVFDSSIQRGIPIEFNLGIGMVIPGWEQGVLGMLIGEKRILTIPADLAYGQAGVMAPDGTAVIPGGATLIFDVELVDVK